MSGTDVPYVCPRCRGAVVFAADTARHEHNGAYLCARCSHSYPVVLGIPDFRVVPDPWIDMEADRTKGVQLHQQTQRQSFEDTVRAYWAMTPDTPTERAERFIQHVLGAEKRSRDWIGGLGMLSDVTTDTSKPTYVLDVGCGTADIAAALGSRANVVGVDVAFRWLVVAKRRLALLNLPAQLVCCNAEALPFANNTFQHAVSLGTPEHVSDVSQMFKECARVLMSHGTVNVRTSNRFSLLREPHVGMLGIGWLPRSLANRVVQHRTGQSYAHHRLLSAPQLREVLRMTGFSSVRVHAASVLHSDMKQFSGLAVRTAIPLYKRAQRIPLVAQALALVAPQLDASAVNA